MLGKENQVIILTEIALMTALAVVIDIVFGLFQDQMFPYGGSINIAMVPIMLMSFRRGIKAGLTTGLLVGIIQIIYGGHVREFYQFIFDYPVAFTVVGLAGVFSKGNKNLSTNTIVVGGTLAGLLRYFSHFLAGVTFWRKYVPEEAFLGIKGFTPFTWSLFYNGLYMIPSIILSVALVLLLLKTAPKLFELNH